MDGSMVAKLFEEKGVDKYLLENYDVLHTQSHQWLVQEIEDYIKGH